MVRAVKPSPRDSPVGFGSRSRTITCTPASRSSPASIRPAGPAPTTLTSASIDPSGWRPGTRNTNGETPPGAGSRLVLGQLAGRGLSGRGVDHRAVRPVHLRRTGTGEGVTGATGLDVDLEVRGSLAVRALLADIEVELLPDGVPERALPRRRPGSLTGALLGGQREGSVLRESDGVFVDLTIMGNGARPRPDKRVSHVVHRSHSSSVNRSRAAFIAGWRRDNSGSAASGAAENA